MSEETQESVDEGAENPETHDNPPEEPEVEQKARSMGWVPKDEFRGDPDKWVEAERFVERGENELPILRERYRNLDKQLKETQDTLKKLAEHHHKVSEREYSRAYEDLKRQRAEAIASGDSQAFEKADSDLEKLRENKPEQVDGPDEKHTPEDEAYFNQWMNDNKWYQTDSAMAGAADAVGQELYNEGYRGKALLDNITKRVKAEFPQKFKNPKREGANSVEGAPSGSRKQSGKGYADLPPDAKQACDKFVKQGVFMGENGKPLPQDKAREQYVKEYFGE